MKKLVLVSLAVLVIAACGTMGSHGPSATATLASTSGSTATGTVRLAQVADGSVDVTVNLAGVPPGVHGFHVHDKGDCGDNGNAAGGHFNPNAMAHGAPSTPPHHAGDFGNVTADADGKVTTQFNTRSITVEAGANSAVGHAIILHANADDLTTQPSGNAGARIACGVVTMNH
ncbi:MAG: superoxide dismutase, Cu-Zn family [Acidobacteriota bacterium]|jgi:Cu-Zn family superoxide dismutase|nr:superoxide dismutase, Cu-Zn family [Acidobacteriota bacterium]